MSRQDKTLALCALALLGLCACTRGPAPSFDSAFVAPACDADQYGNPVSQGETWLKEPRMEFVRVAAGSFTMGSPADELDRGDDEGPPHLVRIAKPFYMGKYEVTQAVYKGVMWKNPSIYRGATTPVDEVRWPQAEAFCRKLSRRAGVGIRLPTEAEWEYACRAGAQTRFSFGDDRDESLVGHYAWHRDNADGRPRPVGRKKPNPWGLYDMHGNVWEWCMDGKRDYTASRQTDPWGPDDQPRVLRGGGWFFPPRYARSAGRSVNDPDFTWDRSGLRVCFVAPVRVGRPR